MALTILTNPVAIGAQWSVNSANDQLAKTIKQLSTGLRINSASDDASGLAVSEKLRSQISGLKIAARNAQDGISLLQTADASMGTMSGIVQRIREITVQAGDPTYTDTDRITLQSEVDNFKEEINRVSTSAEFNTKKLLSSESAALWSATGGLDAIIRGSVVDGSYKVSTNLTPGSNNIYSTQMMTIANGKEAGTIVSGGSIKSIKNVTGTFAGTANFVINITSANTAAGVARANTTAIATGGIISDATVIATTSTSNYTLEIEALTSNSVRYRVMNTATGKLSSWYNMQTSSGHATAKGDDALREAGFTAGSIFNTATATIFKTTAYTTGSVGLVSVRGSLGAIGSTSAGTISLGANGPRVKIDNLFNANYDNTVKVYTAQYGTDGKVYYGSMDLVIGKATSLQKGSTDIQFLKGGDVARQDTQLTDISNFYNADGVNILNNTQTLAIYGNGNKTDIYLDSNDTVSTLQSKLKSAITNSLDMGSNTALANNNLVRFITASTTNAGAGSIVLQGARLGDASEISFAGNQNIMNALGVTKIQSASQSQLQVTVTRADGSTVGSTTTSDGIARNIINNVDLKIDTASLADSTWDATNNKLNFTPKANTQSSLQLKSNASIATIGPNEGQTIDISLGRMDTVSLGIDSVNVLSLDGAQKSLGKLDNALESINSSRAVAGAQINRLDYTINNLNKTREYMVSAESRIRDLDVAEAVTNLTAQQVRLQAATSMLYQARLMPSYAMMLLR